MWLLTAALATPAVVWAQAPAGVPAERAVAPSARPAASGPADGSNEAADAAAPEDPAVEALLASNPTTPNECLRAARTLAGLNRPDLARQFLKKLLDAKPSDADSAALVERFGSPSLLNLAARGELQPEAQQVVDALLAAANRHVQSPERIAQLLAGLASASAEERQAAVVGLRQAGGAAVGAIIEALADPARSAEHPRLRAALAAFGSEAVAPLTGLLERADPRLMAEAIRALGAIGAKKTAYFMLGPYCSPQSDPAVRDAAGAALRRFFSAAPEPAEAVALLVARAEDYFVRREPLEGEHDGKVVLWSWDPGKKVAISREYPAEWAAVELSARLARDAYALEPENHRVRVLYLATMLDCARRAAGWERSLAETDSAAVRLAEAFDVRVVWGVLEYALSADRPAAAVGAIELLGRSGSAELLFVGGAELSPLARAACHSDRRVRLAALEAIVHLKPQRPYPGAGGVPGGLAFFAGTSGARRALVAVPGAVHLASLSGLAAALGFQVDATTSGTEAIRLARGGPDYELALIDAGIDAPTAELLVQRIHRDPASADLRIALVARDGFLPRARQIAARDPMVLALPCPTTKDELAWEIGQVMAIAPERFVAHEERQRQATRALGLLAELSGAPAGLYDLRQVEQSVLQALYVPGLEPPAAEVLAAIGSARAQRALVDLASQWTTPLVVRQAAKDAFAGSVRRYGILLTSGQILEQYARYNRSAQLDADTQQVLGALLDAIEEPARQGAPTATTEPSPPQ